MNTRSEVLKLKNKYFIKSTNLSTLALNDKLDLHKAKEIRKKQDEAYKKYEFFKKLGKELDNDRNKFKCL